MDPNRRAPINRANLINRNALTNLISLKGLTVRIVRTSLSSRNTRQDARFNRY